MTEHLPEHAVGHGPPGSPRPPSDTERLASVLSTLQFVFTVLVLAVLAGLMYTAGLNSGKGHGEGGGGGQAVSASAVDVQALLTPTPELIATGKNLFSINCASCHGAGGKGDGPAAVALNPKPRDFTSGYWRYGGGVARIVRTITTGSPGTAMAPFPGIPIQDRFALAQYIRSFNPQKQEPDKPEDLAWLEQFGGHKGPAGGEGATPAVAGGAPGDTLPIARAIALIAEPAESYAAAADQTISAPPDSSEGGLLYARRCASCHGPAGEGGVRTAIIGSAPYAYVVTAPLGRGRPPAHDAAGFEQLVIRGLPGNLMSSNGDLTSEQIRALYAYTQSLRARLESAARARS